MFERPKLPIFLILITASCYFSCSSKSELLLAKKKLDTLNALLYDMNKNNINLHVDYLKLQGQFKEHLRRDSILALNSSNISTINKGMIFFPNPPPQPTGRFIFEQKLFYKSKNYQDINIRLLELLKKGGYENRTHYFLFDDGFVIATDLEQIFKDGTPLPNVQRWSVEQVNLLTSNFSMREYISRLFTAKSGFYRSFVFIASPSLNRFSSEDYPKELFSKYISQGSITLPNRIALAELTKDFKVTVLIYEFEKKENSSKATLMSDGIMPLEHLRKANILR